MHTLFNCVTSNLRNLGMYLTHFDDVLLWLKVAPQSPQAQMRETGVLPSLNARAPLGFEGWRWWHVLRRAVAELADLVTADRLNLELRESVEIVTRMHSEHDTIYRSGLPRIRACVNKRGVANFESK